MSVCARRFFVNGGRLCQDLRVRVIRGGNGMAAQAKKKKGKPQPETRPERPRSLMQRLAELERDFAQAQAAQPPQAKAA